MAQEGFHESFKGKKIIGRGGFATVFQVNRVNDNKSLASKAFSKKFLKATKNEIGV